MVQKYRVDYMKLLTLLLLVAAPMVVHAQFTFTTNNGTLTIKGYTGPGGTVVIPSTTNGLTVTSIGINAFLNSTSLTNVTIPNSVTSMGDYAFYNCTSLTNATFGTGLTNIGSQGFFGCTNLTSAIIPNSVTSIGKSAFFSCFKLPKVAIPNKVTNLGEYAFYGCSGLTNLTIGTNVTSIDYEAFTSCSSLPSLTIPNSVTNIGEESFYGCSGLTNLIIGSKVISIGTNAFYACKKLPGILIPTNVISLADFAFGDCEGLTNIIYNATSIGAGAFYYCTSLPSVTVPRGLTNIGTGAFDSCDSLTNITADVINPVYSSVAGVLFNKNKTTLIECPAGIRSYTIPDGVTKIQDLAFLHCYSLRSVIIPNSITSIGNSAFSTSPNLTTVYCKGNAPSPGSEVFYADTDATIYYLAGRTGWSATFGGQPAVMLDPSLGSLLVTISPPDAITAGAWWQVDNGVPQTSGAIITGLSTGTHTVTYRSLEYYGWATPVNQTVVVTANSLTNTTGTYGQLTYTTNNNAITITGSGPAGPGFTVILPGIIYGRPVTTIGDYAFFGRTDLTNITIPSSVTNIGHEVFTWCSGLRAITVDPANAFYSSSNGVLFNKDQTTLVQYPGGVGGSCTIPQSVTSIGDYAFEFCTSLTSITIPNNVTNIGNVAFYECSSLANVMIGANVINIGGRAFQSCDSLTGIYFHGNAPIVDSDSFGSDNNATVYYLPGTTGWDTTLAGIPAVLWNPQATTFIADGNQFGFNITGPTNATIVVEACTDPANPIWLPVSTNTLSESGTSFFSDPQWTNYPARFYRFRSP